MRAVAQKFPIQTEIRVFPNVEIKSTGELALACILECLIQQSEMDREKARFLGVSVSKCRQEPNGGFLLRF